MTPHLTTQWAIALIIGTLAIGGIVIVYRLAVADDRRHRIQHEHKPLLPVPPVGHDTIAMLCLCCNGAKGPDCICTDDCGNPRCQANDPEEAVP